MNIPELLSPAGSPEALDAAAGAGADAVYFGLKGFNARLRSSNFAYSQAEGAVRALHKMGRKCYITVNTVFEQREADRVYQLLNYLANIGVDGVIAQDFGVVLMAHRYVPALKLHASTQMNIASARGANALSKYGVSRVVLARELSLEEIKDARVNTNAELEVFVHGALCVSCSGLCLFSSFLGGKSANRGLCTQACRRFYRSEVVQGGAVTSSVNTEGYFFSPADLQMIEKVPMLVDTGVNALKIEGRMKSADYVGAVTGAYRTVLDALGGGEAAVAESVEKAKEILKNDFARAKTLFHFDGKADDFSFLNPDQAGGTGIPLGKILKTRSAGETRLGLIAYSGVLAVGDSIRVHKTGDVGRFSHKLNIVEPSGDAGTYWADIPPQAAVGDEAFLIQTKSLSKRYAPVIPKNLSAFRRTPGFEKAPLIEMDGVIHHSANLRRAKTHGTKTRAAKDTDQRGTVNLPEGVYVEVSHISDLYIIQSVKPVKVLLHLTRKTLAHFLDTLDGRKPPLPFPASAVIPVLSPYYPQSLEALLPEALPRLAQAGCPAFVANNPAHFSLLRNTGAIVIAGPWLYAFNHYAATFLKENGALFIVSPLENNRQNLERTFEDRPADRERSSVFVTVFSYPPLFRIRGNLGGTYRWTRFSGGDDERFSLISDLDESLVFPQTPFSIVDKITFLREAGFSHFIVDFSGNPVRKKDYKAVMNAVDLGTPLPGVSRFNWKNGFFTDKA